MGYNHVYLFMKSSTGVPNKSKELFFKFGDWCYHGCINLPFEEIMEKDLSVVIHIIKQGFSRISPAKEKFAFYLQIWEITK